MSISDMIENYPIYISNKEHLASVSAGRHYLIATDGACKGNPGRGGWGLVKQLWDGKQLLRQAPNAGQSPYVTTTNVRMEMMAALKAVVGITETDTPAVILSDNEMVIKGMTEWITGWKTKGWRGSKGPLANVDLWQQLDAACVGKVIHWFWVKGHAGHDLNEIADTLASNAALGKYPKGRKTIQIMNPELFINRTHVYADCQTSISTTSL
ncbi:ribonuclease H family protein [Ochrobactrum soli]|uniref:ribonuclease H family protein n=1 Tax=Ochrobactrum soli TaxID=2448455 RepID=UPI001ADF8533|nr:ribonuclease H [[Ochrobactrum] soli]